MSLFLDDGDVKLYHGDALEQLRGLPDASVDMVATSPPFYGLRDYGTGEWEGGDEGCEHAPKMLPGSGRADGIVDERAQRSRDGTIKEPRRCGKCSAVRVDRQIGLEETPDQWVQNLVAVFAECRRVLADHGTLWVEIGDSYAHPAMGGTAGSSPDGPRGGRLTEAGRSPSTMGPGLKQKDLLGQPWLLAFALRADGWYLRSEIIWARPNPMPESVTDRPTKSHSTVFLLSKRPRYFYDADAIREEYKYDGRKVTHVQGGDGSIQHRNGERWPGLGNRPDRQRQEHEFPGTRSMGGRQDNPAGANARSVWTIPTEPTPFAHFATWPRKLVARMIQAGTSERGRCPECGKPWVRDVERKPVSQPTYSEARGYSVNGARDTVTRFGDGLTVTTLGWSPSCAHDAPPVPCVVLDPFAGSGTTLLVARQHGRHAVGIELSADYCALAADRLKQLSLLTEAQT